MRFNYLLSFSFLFFLFSCNENNDHDGIITHLDDRLSILNENIMSINLSIDKMDKELIELNKKINLLSNDFSNKTNLASQSYINNNSVIATAPLDFEKLFYDNYSISSISHRTCGLKNIKTNKIKNFKKGEEIKIFPSTKDTTQQIYKILELDRIKGYVKLINLNYNEEFKLLFKTDRQ